MSMLGLYARIKRRDRPVRVDEPASRSAHEQEDLTRAIHAKVSLSVLRIRIRRIRMFLGLLDPDLLVRGTDPDRDPDLSSSKNSKKNLDSYCFVNSF
jgi:hypothetical protein